MSRNNNQLQLPRGRGFNLPPRANHHGRPFNISSRSRGGNRGRGACQPNLIERFLAQDESAIEQSLAQASATPGGQWANTALDAIESNPQAQAAFDQMMQEAMQNPDLSPQGIARSQRRFEEIAWMAGVEVPQGGLQGFMGGRGRGARGQGYRGGGREGHHHYNMGRGGAGMPMGGGFPMGGFGGPMSGGHFGGIPFGGMGGRSGGCGGRGHYDNYDDDDYGDEDDGYYGSRSSHYHWCDQLDK